MIWLVQTAEGGWRPGIGDPTVLGWLTVAGYLFAAYAAWRARGRATGKARVLRWTWTLIAVLMLLLAINKQLDLQSLFTVVAKQRALRDGWYKQRQVYQRWFIEGLAFAGLAASLGALVVLRKHLRELWLAALGSVFIVIFVLIRAASFHHVDAFLRGGAVRMNAVLELGGIACVAVAALRFRRV